MKNYQSILSFLYRQLPMHQRIGPKAIKLDLSNIISLMDLLDNPQDQLKYVHVTGTNGKGSVSHYIASILQEAGHKVGLYTSPHYKDFRERCKINGQLIPKNYVVAFVNRLKVLGAFETLKPSFFEISVALAFDYFASSKVDGVVLEVGLGGRLDSTNIITPVLSVITNIGLDHQNTLGDTLVAIAGEKAGIIKQDIPVLIGEYQKEVKPVFEKKANSLDAPLYYSRDLLNKTSIQVKEAINPFYRRNVETSLSASYLLKDLFNISEQHQRNGIENVRKNCYYIGRFQTLVSSPRVLADGAHNLPGLKALFGGIAKMSFGRLHIVLAMVGDKPLDKVLALFPKDAKYYFAKADIPRGKNKTVLKNEASSYGLLGKEYISVRKALAAAKQSAHKNDLVLVTGSIYTVAEVI